jgi:phosphomannomutase
MLLDLIDRILTFIDPDPAIAKDASGRMPDTMEPNTLYLFPDPDADIAFVNEETGPARRQNFRLIALLLADAENEEATQTRLASVTGVLSSKRDDYLAKFAARESCDLWEHVEATADMDFTRNFEGRAVALMISGYRYV